MHERHIANQHHHGVAIESEPDSGGHHAIDSICTAIRPCPGGYTTEPFKVTHRHRRRHNKATVSTEKIGHHSRHGRFCELGAAQQPRDGIGRDGLGLGPVSTPLWVGRWTLHGSSDHRVEAGVGNDVVVRVDTTGPADLHHWRSAVAHPGRHHTRGMGATDTDHRRRSETGGDLADPQHGVGMADHSALTVEARKRVGQHWPPQ